MKNSIKVVLTLLLLTLSLTACGKASATSGSTASSSSTEANTTASDQASDDASSTAASKLDSSNSSPADVTEPDPTPDVAEPIGTPSTVDPHQFFDGDFFDIISYYRACGSESFHWQTEYDNRVGFRGNVCDHSIGILGDAHITALVDVRDLDPYKTSNTYIAIDGGNNEYVWLDKEHTVRTYTSTLEILFAVMQNIEDAGDGCPFAGLGIEHTQMNHGQCND